VIAAELLAGGGGTALGLEAAGFTLGALVDSDWAPVKTLRQNRPQWPVHNEDITSGRLTGAYDLVSAGLPGAPHSRAGKQLGKADERDLWDDVLDLVAASVPVPRALMLETTDAVLGDKFGAERDAITGRLHELGYTVLWETIDCLWFGVSQRRKRAILIAFREPQAAAAFRWPTPDPVAPPTVGELLHERMAALGWPGADRWRARANDWAPTLVGGSEKHGGADLGPAGTKAAWRRLGIDGSGIADDVPGPGGMFERSEGKLRDANATLPMLTIGMAAALQGFPGDWDWVGGKTGKWRMIGNALPPPAARALGRSVAAALSR